MNTSSRTILMCASTVLLAGLGPLGCGGASAPEPASEDAHASPPEGLVVLDEILVHVRPRLGKITFERPSRRHAGGPSATPQNLDSIDVVSDGVAGSGPANTVELITNSVGYDGDCGSFGFATFCGNVTLNHFYDLDLSDVFVQITAVKDDNGVLMTGHSGVNSDPVKHDLDNIDGLWIYSNDAAKPGIVPRSPSNSATRDWVFANPDDADTNLTIRVVGSLYPTLWFNADDTVDVSAPLVAGQPGIIHYAYDRLQSCRGTGWSMTGFFKGNPPRERTVSYLGQPGDTYFDLHFTVPFGAETTFRFEDFDSTGCNQYDGSFGAGYGVAPIAATDVIHFMKDLSPSISGSVTAGGALTIDYDLDRLTGCGSVNTYDRLPANITASMYYSFDAGAPQQVSLVGTPLDVAASINGQPGNLQVAPVIQIPTGAAALQIWFGAADDATCTTSDGSSSAPFTFAIAP